MMSKKKVKPPKDRGNVFLYGTIIFLVLFIIGGAIYSNKMQEAKLDENATQSVAVTTKAAHNKEKKEKTSEEKEEETTTAVATTEPTTTAKSIRIKVVIDTLKVRSKPSEDGEIVDLVDEDDEFSVIKKEGKWYLINSGSGEGYVSADFVEEID